MLKTTGTIFILIAVILLFTGCGETERDPEQPIEENVVETEEGVSPTNEADGVSITHRQLPDDWPESVPIMDGFVYSHSINPEDNEYFMAYAEGTVEINDAKDFYSTLAGWEKDPSGAWVDTPDLVSGALIDSDGNQLEFNLSPIEDKIGMTLIFTPYHGQESTGE